ncbi:hypothetical protein [Micromonospora sp. HM5-17]|uniref:hypothetical protein n=1 Tax=Micromonospora sp. HM5-17 TaxID=2487710 RepID=UPI001F16C1B8|nr:hypothetical protein [Micromonospora sp. HM5-17]
MDVFVRTLLPAAAETGVAGLTVSRHLPILRNCVQAADAAVLVARCIRPEQPAHSYLLLLTTRRLVVTQQSRVLQRLRLHLNTELRHLSNVTWTPDPRTSLLELAATAVDGVRERFMIRVDRPSQMWQLDALFNHVFRPRMVAPSTAPAAPPAVPAGVVPARDARAVPPARTTPATAPHRPTRASRLTPAAV